MLTNVPKEHTSAVMMLCAVTRMEVTTVPANQDLMEMVRTAKVLQNNKLYLERASYYSKELSNVQPSITQSYK